MSCDRGQCTKSPSDPPIPETEIKRRPGPIPKNRVAPHVQKEWDRFFAEKSKPFGDNNPLTGEPDCSWKAVQKHLLRACPFSTGDLIFQELLGYGLDGVVWKVKIHETFYALKVFWDVEIPEKSKYYAIQTECWNSAILQMIAAGLAKSDEPIYLKPEIKCRKDAIYNIQAFCDEARATPRFKGLPGAVPITSFPRFRKCFGWLTVNRSLFQSRRIRVPEAHIDHTYRAFCPDIDYYAILYEYIPPGEEHVDTEGFQAQLDLLYLVGFEIRDLRPENWVGGILVDMAALESPWQMHWSHRSHEHYDATKFW